MNLVLPTLWLTYLRIFGGMAPNRHRAARAVALGVLLCAFEAFAIWEARRQATANGALGALVPPVVAITMYLVGGSVILLSVATRDTTGSTRRALMTLPLSRIGTVLLEWIPVISIALVLLGLVAIPGVTALVSAGYPVPSGISLVAAALGAGTGSSGLLLAAVSALLRDGAWDATRYPLAMLVWAATAATAVGRSFAQGGTTAPSVGDALLILPSLVRQAGLGAPVDAWVGAVLGVSAALAVAVVVPWALSGRLSERRRQIRWSWTGGPTSSLLTGELVYSTRNTTIVANAVAMEVLVLGLCLLLGTVPTAFRIQLLAPIMITAACFVGSIVRQHRSLFSTVRPPQQLINLENAPWVVRQLAIGVLWFGALYAPPAVAALWLGLPPDTVLSTWGYAGATSFAASTLVGWLIPFPLDNAPGQLLASAGGSAITAALSAFVVDLGSNTPWLALAVCALAVPIVIAAAIAAEHRRWSPH